MKNFFQIWDEPPSAMGQKWSWNVSNIGQLPDQEKKTWEMESAIIVLQCETVSPKEGEYLQSSSHQTPATPYGEP